MEQYPYSIILLLFRSVDMMTFFTRCWQTPEVCFMSNENRSKQADSNLGLFLPGAWRWFLHGLNTSTECPQPCTAMVGELWVDAAWGLANASWEISTAGSRVIKTDVGWVWEGAESEPLSAGRCGINSERTSGHRSLPVWRVPKRWCFWWLSTGQRNWQNHEATSDPKSTKVVTMRSCPNWTPHFVFGCCSSLSLPMYVLFFSQYYTWTSIAICIKYMHIYLYPISFCFSCVVNIMLHM